MHRCVVMEFKGTVWHVEKMDEQWDIDLMDMTDYADENADRYVLMAIDVFKIRLVCTLKSKKFDVLKHLIFTKKAKGRKL